MCSRFGVGKKKHVLLRDKHQGLKVVRLILGNERCNIRKTDYLKLKLINYRRYSKTIRD